MRYSRAIAAMVLVAVLGGWVSAATKSATERVPQPLGNNPHPVIWSSSPPPKPATPPPQPRPAPPRTCNRNNPPHNDDHHHDGHHWRGCPGRWVPYYWCYPYNNYGCWESPVVESAPQSEPMADVVGPWPNDNAGAFDPPADEERAAKKARAAQVAAARRDAVASKSIGSGDAFFATKKYADANERYRKAARTTPQVGAAWFRQGFALAAMGRSNQAATAFKRGLKLDPAWPESNFSLDQLFGGNAAAKNDCFATLNAAVADKPTDADRLFVLGVFLHFDGQLDRAAAIFARAEQAAGNNLGHITAFVDAEQ